MEIEVKGFDLGGGDEETFNVIFDKMKKECFNDLVSPALYFTQPYELLRLFEGIEKQQLSYLEYVTHLAPMLKQAREESKLLKNSIIQDNALVLNTIKSLEAILKFNEVRCAQLETKFFKIINGLFYASVGAPEVINMFLDLEYCYGKLYSEKPINSDLITLAKDLESFYMYYWKCLDAILSDKTNIQKAVTQYEEIQRKKFRRAKFAKRELCEFERLKRSLIRAFEPPSSRAGVLHNRTVSENNRPCFKLNKAVKPNKLKKKHSGQDFSKTTPIKTLTASELEYLELFTEWTCDEDPYKYLHSDSVYEIKPM
ncbi:coiled-coil domain-containing protein 38-like [Amyelois transitella]|uniref:coiled-coil domain-containing protein 38-like n=1 Tax=Amyelois transitella TaxID=680683 RepID=UPI0029907F29|nr:coiled-coil domain-containing protein 38-like [Amyelois transitella]